MSGGVSASTVFAGIGAASAVGSLGMGILGSANQSSAQRAAGEQAYQAALIRQQQLQMQSLVTRNEAVLRRNEAQQQDTQAKVMEDRAGLQEQQAQGYVDAGNAAEATKQREAIEYKRKATLAAGRAKTLMAASGAAVDPGTLAAITGEGEYGKDVALFEGAAAGREATQGAKAAIYDSQMTRFEAKNKRYDANLTRYQAGLDDWSADNMIFRGQSEVAMGAGARSAANRAADTTMLIGLGTGLTRGLSLAARYGGSSSPSEYKTLGYEDTRSAYNALPKAYSNPGFDSVYDGPEII